MFLELIMLPRMNNGNIERLVSFQGLEHIEAALHEGKGAILPVPHFGNVRLLHYALALKGYPMSVVSSNYSEDPEIVRKYKLGETSKIPQIGYRGDNPRWIFQALKNNRLVQIASTAEAGNVGVEVHFMNRDLFLTSGWVRLAYVTGTPVLPTCIVRNDDNRHIIHIQPPLSFSPGEKREEIVRSTAQALLTQFEPIYKENPHLIDWMSWMVRLEEAKEHFGKKDE